MSLAAIVSAVVVPKVEQSVVGKHLLFHDLLHLFDYHLVLLGRHLLPCILLALLWFFHFYRKELRVGAVRDSPSEHFSVPVHEPSFQLNENLSVVLVVLKFLSGAFQLFDHLSTLAGALAQKNLKWDDLVLN